MRLLRFSLCVLLVLCSGIGLVAFSAGARAELLDWNYPAGNTSILSATSTTTVNGVSISSSAVAAGPPTTNSTTIQPAGSSNGSSTGIINLTMDAANDDLTTFQTVTVQFSEPVYNVSFKVFDIDGGPAFNNASGWNDIVDFGSSAGPPSGVVANATWVSYNAGTGRASAINNQNAVSGNANQNNGTITVTYPGPITFFSVRHYSGPINNPGQAGDETDPGGQLIIIDDVTFTRSARLAIAKTSTGGVGTFNFSNSNGLTFTAPSTYVYGTTSFSVTTVTAGVAVTGPSQILGVVNSPAVVTETGPASWVVSTTTSTCTDSNSAVSTNPASFTAPVVNNALTLAAANVKAGAIITCSLTNVPAAPQMTITKVANTAGPVNVGNVIGYTYRVTNTGNVRINNVTVNDVHGGFGIDPAPGSETLFNDVAPLGDSTDAATNGTWNSLAPGDTIQFTSSYSVVQADIDNLQ
jgi:hypothetical protein